MMGGLHRDVFPKRFIIYHIPMKQFFLIVFFAISTLAAAQIDTSRIEQLTRQDIMSLTQDDLLALPFDKLILLAGNLGVSIDELLEMTTGVASKTALTPRETPGIVSIITEEEIKKSGARDLADVLQLVPGLHVTQGDGDGVFGIQMRGNWSYEGKVLLVVDGQEFNDLKYSGVALGHRFDPSNIKKVEVIRGPGSSIYGGNAEIGVISVTTRSGNEIDGVSATATYGVFSGSDLNADNFERRSISLSAGTRLRGVDVVAHGFLSEGNLTDLPVTDAYGLVYEKPLQDKAAYMTAKNVNLGISTEKFRLRFIADDYNTLYFDSLSNWNNEFFTYTAEAGYTLQLNDKMKLSPRINYRNTMPYHSDGYSQNTSISRYTGNLHLDYVATSWLNVMAGAEYQFDQGRMVEDDPDAYFDFEGEQSKTIRFGNVVFYGQAVAKTKAFNIVAGGRIDNHSQYGSAFAPRLGLTRVFGDFHAKLLYSSSFRSPGIGNILFEPQIKPERTHVLELETGYKINEQMFITANLYHMRINDPIIWFNADTLYGYRNDARTGTSGLELEYRLKSHYVDAAIHYAYYTNGGKNTVEDYVVPTNERLMAGAAPHKAGMRLIINPSGRITVSPSAWLLGRLYAPGFNDDGEMDMREYQPSLRFNLFVNYQGRMFDFGLGVYDLFDSRQPRVQGYNGYMPPLPGHSPEIMLRLSYRLGF